MSATSEPSSPALPLIGICAVRERARWAFWDQTAHLVADAYVREVSGGGGAPRLLPVLRDAVPSYAEAIDGLLVIGGADLDPEVYGAEPAPETEATYRERDEFELAMVQRALDRGIPVLGICRGMQVLNVALGGTLRQDIGGPDGQTIHRRRLGSFDGTENHVELVEGSLAARAAGEGLHVAHCHHHQAIDRLADGLVVTGRAVEDGLAEAVEAADGRWVLGVQWHPEARDESAIVASFVRAAAERLAERPAEPASV